MGHLRHVSSLLGRLAGSSAGWTSAPLFFDFGRHARSAPATYQELAGVLPRPSIVSRPWALLNSSLRCASPFSPPLILWVSPTTSSLSAILFRLLVSQKNTADCTAYSLETRSGWFRTLS